MVKEIWQNPNEITQEEQKAFNEVLEKVVLVEPKHFELKKENILTISQEIQKQFMDVFDEKYEKRNNKFFRKIVEAAGILVEDEKDLEKLKDEGNFSDMKEGLLPKDKIEHTLAFLSIANNQLEEYTTYDSLGFTPKLAQESEIELGGMNCFGTNLFIGALCRRLNIPVKMGIAADHPVIFADFEGKTYMIDGVNRDNKMQIPKGEMKDYGTYKIYYPTKEDKRYDKIIFMHDFDKAVLYEVLENLQAYRQSVLGSKEVLLPHGRDRAFEFATLNKDVLSKANWGQIKQKLFPEMVASFASHQEEWKDSYRVVRENRVEDSLYQKLFNIHQEVTKETGFKYNFGSNKETHALFEKYKIEIHNFLEKGVPLGGDMPENMKDFFELSRRKIDENSEESEALIELMLKIHKKHFPLTKE